MVEHIGRAAAFEMLAEEACELAHAAQKMARILRGENPTPCHQAEVFRNVVEELGDVYLCAMDLEIAPSPATMIHKLRRFDERIEGEKEC